MPRAPGSDLLPGNGFTSGHRVEILAKINTCETTATAGQFDGGTRRVANGEQTDESSVTGRDWYDIPWFRKPFGLAIVFLLFMPGYLLLILDRGYLLPEARCGLSDRHQIETTDHMYRDLADDHIFAAKLS
jgi:hypothetical protein